MQIPECTEIRDAHIVSRLLDRTLRVLAKSKLSISAASVARETGFLPSHISRMRNAWKKPASKSAPPLIQMRSVLDYLCRRYPTLVIRPSSDGTYTVRLYKRYEGQMVNQLREPEILLKKRAPKPGTTRWFMNQGKTFE